MPAMYECGDITLSAHIDFARIDSRRAQDYFIAMAQSRGADSLDYYLRYSPHASFHTALRFPALHDYALPDIQVSINI